MQQDETCLRTFVPDFSEAPDCPVIHAILAEVGLKATDAETCIERIVRLVKRQLLAHVELFVSFIKHHSRH